MDEQLTLTHLIEPADEIDSFLLEEILLLVQNRTTLAIVDSWIHKHFGTEKGAEKYLDKIMWCVTALIKANAHRRNYKKIKEEIIVQIRNSPELDGTSIDILFNKVDTSVIIEGFLSQLKTSLDILAQSLKPLYGIENHTWSKKLDTTTQRQLSGLSVAQALGRNVKTDIKHSAKPLIELIVQNSEKITEIVELRDSATHYGQIEKIQGFRYSVTHNEIVPPIIAFSATEAKYVEEYMDITQKYLSEFVQEFIVSALSHLFPDMVVIKDNHGKWGWSASGSQ